MGKAVIIGVGPERGLGAQLCKRSRPKVCMFSLRAERKRALMPLRIPSIVRAGKPPPF